jgi:hypothetical protein
MQCDPVLYTAGAYRKDGTRFTVIADDKLTAFLELKKLHAKHFASKMPNDSAQFAPCNLLIAFA